MAHNLEIATLVGLVFSGFIQAVRSWGLAKEGTDALVRGAQGVLPTLPFHYQNRLFLELCEKHGSLKRYWAAAQPEHPAA